MRILELEIQKVRGLPNLKLEPGGKTFVVHGPNGSGKSAIVDALDFLLTGSISRLEGRGTKGISLARHGAHIDYERKDATVQARIEYPGVDTPLTLTRRMSRPKVLVCDPHAPGVLEAIERQAAQGLHALTRREILRFITAEASSRADQIQALLDISAVEDVRATVVSVHGELERKSREASSARDRARAAVRTTIGADRYDDDSVLQAVNADRRTLGADPLSAALSADLKRDVRRPATIVARRRPCNVELLEADLRGLRGVKEQPPQARLRKADLELRQLIGDIRSSPERRRALDVLGLLEAGIALVDETGRCPLCDKPWPPGKLRAHLEQKLALAKEVKETHDRIRRLAGSISESIASTTELLRRGATAASTVLAATEVEWLKSWRQSLEELSATLDDPLGRYPPREVTPEQVQRMLAPREILRPLRRLQSAVAATVTRPSPEETAWDRLTALQENLRALEAADRDLRLYGQSDRRALILQQTFEEARDKVLNELYDSVRNQFERFYRELHRTDESAFAARLEPDGAGLRFEVDFYERGLHSPQALHSEGHQDSMGLCLYLALADAFSRSDINLIILDDVMMSIDRDHRKQVSHLLKTFFTDRQFLITTHDTTWARELQQDGVVEAKNTTHLYDWSVDHGPRTRPAMEEWEVIEEALTRDDVPSAASRLRRELEQYFDEVCAALSARTPHRLDQRWELEDLMSPAIGRYRGLLRAAKAAAQSWADREALETLVEQDGTFSQILLRVNAEKWAVNPSVHYSRLLDLGSEDFRPVCEAFRDLCDVFRCTKCRALLYVAVDKQRQDVALRCNCESVNWNLIKKPSATP